MQGSRSPVPYLLLAWLTGAWCAGIVAGTLLGAGAALFGVAIAAGCCAVALARRSRIAAVYTIALPTIFLGAVAWQHAAAEKPLDDDNVARFNDGVEMRFRGVLRDDPDIGDTTQRFAIDVRQVQRQGAWVDASGGVQVVTAILPRYRAGDVLEVEGKLESPQPLDDFDYAAYLARRGIHSTVAFPQAHRIGHEDPALMRRALLSTRRALSHGIALSLPEPQAALAQGVLLGERSALDPDTLSDLTATNTSHLVVVSGGNIVLVAAFSAMLFGAFARRRRAQALSIAIVLAYAALVGFSPPVLRATIMGIVLIAAGMSGRRGNGVTALLLAAAVMTALDPLIVSEVSFQLSFAATAGILWLATPVRAFILAAIARVARRETVPGWSAKFIAEPAATTIAAVAATTPLIALNFGRVSLVALPANMLVVPAFPFILTASFFAAIGGLLPIGHVMLGAPAYLLLSYWLGVAHWLGGLPAAAAPAAGYDRIWAVATYATLVALAVFGVRRMRGVEGPPVTAGSRFTWRSAARSARFGVPVLALMAGIGWIAGGSTDARLEVTVLDVGQGDAILIESPSGTDVLVDGGPGPAVLRGLGRELAWNDRSLDLVVLTHPQMDHGAGLVDVFDRYDVSRVALTRAGDHSIVAREIDRAARDEGASIAIARAGDSYDLGDGARLDVLWPPAPLSPETSLNNNGIVLRLSWRGVSFLLTADIEAPVEEQLLAEGIDLRADVLKVAHHGSKTSSTRNFLDAVQPRVAVISSGARNHYGHPAPDIVDRLDDYGAVFNTAISGDVHFETDGARLWIDTGD